MKTAALLLLLAALPTEALDKWTWTDTALEVSYLTLHAGDWATTRDGTWRRDEFASHPRAGVRLHEESNPVLGKNPSYSQINAYFAVTALAHVAIARVLPGRWRTAWQASTIGMEFAIVHHNVQGGLSFRF